MKPNDNIDKLFDDLKDQWDVSTPEAGHENRFLEKLETQNSEHTLPKKSNLGLWKALSIAASLAILVTIGIQFFQSKPVETNSNQTEKSLEVERTEFYFTSLINKEVEKLEAESTPETKQMADDAMNQLKKLENDYKKLEEDLANDGDTKQILNAMIINFQTRINLLQDVLDQISEIKQLKTSNNESQVI